MSLRWVYIHGTAPKATTYQKRWRTVVVYITDVPDATNTIKVGGGREIYAEYAPGPTLIPRYTDNNARWLAGKEIELPVYYSDTPNSIPNYDQVNGVWDETDNHGFSSGAYLTIKAWDNV